MSTWPFLHLICFVLLAGAGCCQGWHRKAHNLLSSRLLAKNWGTTEKQLKDGHGMDMADINSIRQKLLPPLETWFGREWGEDQFDAVDACGKALLRQTSDELLWLSDLFTGGIVTLSSIVEVTEVLLACAPLIPEEEEETGALIRGYSQAWKFAVALIERAYEGKVQQLKDAMMDFSSRVAEIEGHKMITTRCGKSKIQLAVDESVHILAHVITNCNDGDSSPLTMLGKLKNKANNAVLDDCFSIRISNWLRDMNMAKEEGVKMILSEQNCPATPLTIMINDDILQHHGVEVGQPREVAKCLLIILKELKKKKVPTATLR